MGKLVGKILGKGSAKMTDPSDAMQSFQHELLRGTIRPQRGVLDPDLYVYRDNPNGEKRLTYVRLEGKTVTAFVEVIPCEPIEGTPCFAIAYAVPEAYRNQGRAKEAVKAAISELQHGLARLGAFYVEAIVGADNKSSQHVAERVISNTAIATTEHISGLPAFRYVRKVEPRTNMGFAVPRQTTVGGSNVGRNAPCPCGSGKKYKKCCGRTA